MTTSLPWYKEVSPTQKKALFAAWLGYIFDGKKVASSNLSY